MIHPPPPTPRPFSWQIKKNRSMIFSALDRGVTTVRFPWIPVRMTSSPKWLLSFILTYFSVYGVSPFKYSFNFSHKSVMVICSSFSAQYLRLPVCLLNTSSLHFSRATEGYWNAFFALKLSSNNWPWYNASADGFCSFVLRPSSEHACASFSLWLTVLIS